MENLVGYAKRDLMIPDGTRPADLTAANEAAAAWCEEVNAAMHSEICAVPAQRLDTERPLLGRAAVAAARDRRQADQPQGRQAVLRPVRVGPLLGAEPAHRHQVLITVTDEQVQVLEPFTGEVVAEHALVAPGETSIADEHYGFARPDKPRRAPRARTETEAVPGPRPRRRNVPDRRRRGRGQLSCRPSWARS